MTTAPQADQRRLLELQQLDTRLARLAHERRSLPAIAALAELDGRADDLHRAQVRASTEVSDLERELTRAEADVAQVRTRRERTQARYDTGEGLSRELVALQDELASLAKRQDVLEDAELAVMDRLETARAQSAEIAELEDAVRRDQEKRTAERDAEWARLDEEHARVQADRDALAADLRSRADSAEMLDIYEHARERSGGLGAVAMYGHQAEGMTIDLPLSELSRLDNAADDELVVSDEYGYVLVRMGQKPTAS